MDGNIITEFAGLISGIFGEKRWAKALTVIIILAGVLIGFFAWDRITGDFTLRSFEKRVDLLSSLYDLEQSGITTSANLSPIYLEMVQEIKNYKPTLYNVIPDNISPNLSNFLGGFIFWVFLGGAILLTDTTNKGNTFLGATAAGVIFGLVAIVIPDNVDNGINFLAGVGMQIAFIILILLWQRITARAKASSAR
ncbi:MAG: hypothetical protein H6672_00830 [Anaerolineaceae bacterium]|nr:hypothetical protein [Anaerolineaceae bacterium]